MLARWMGLETLIPRGQDYKHLQGQKESNVYYENGIGACKGLDLCFKSHFHDARAIAQQ